MLTIRSINIYQLDVEMHQEFAYFSTTPLDFPLGDEIDVVNASTEAEYIVSNDPCVNAVIYAPEIYFYLTRSKTSLERVR